MNGRRIDAGELVAVGDRAYALGELEHGLTAGELVALWRLELVVLELVGSPS